MKTEKHCRDQEKRTCESLGSSDGPFFPSLLGHAQSRSMSDISRTPNTDQVVKPLPLAAMEGQGRTEPLVSGMGAPLGRTPLCEEQESPEGPRWGLRVGLRAGTLPSAALGYRLSPRRWLCARPWGCGGQRSRVR